MVPWLYYTYYGDDSLIRQAYPMMKRYVDYLTGRADQGILSYGLGDWYDYGPHPAGYSKNSPIALSATAHYYLGITYVKRAADLLGYREEARQYARLAEQVKVAYNRAFFHPETTSYATGSQFSNAISLYVGLVEPPYRQGVLDQLVADIRQHGYRLTTGDIGNRYLFQTLAQNGLNEVMYQMHNHTEVPGYGYQVKLGMTTLTEQWDPLRGNSWNHFMLGQIEEWFYHTLAGIQPDPDKPGFQHFVIKPSVPGDMTWVKAQYTTPYGIIAVKWQKTASDFQLNVTIPVNTTATILMPYKSNCQINGKITKGSKKMVLSSGEYVVIQFL
jgi:hypothetical protein